MSALAIDVEIELDLAIGKIAQGRGRNRQSFVIALEKQPAKQVHLVGAGDLSPYRRNPMSSGPRICVT